VVLQRQWLGFAGPSSRFAITIVPPRP